MIFNSESVLENETQKAHSDFEIQTDHLISARWPDLVIVNNNKKKKERTSRTVGIVDQAAHRVKLKESENKDKYLDLAKEQKKLWNRKETLLLIIIGALGRVTKGLVLELGDLKIRG